MGKLKKEYNKRLSNTRQQFLLTFFGDNGKEDKNVNGFWLVKHWNGNTEDWEVAIYPEDSYARYSTFLNEKKQQSLGWIK